MPPAALAERVANGGAWLVALTVTTRLLGLLRILVLVRLLSPRDFGLAGVAVVSLSLLDALSVAATRLALIRDRSTDRGLLDAAWTLSLLRGGLLACLMFCAARPIAIAFEAPEALGLVRTMALVPLLQGLLNVGVVEWKKRLSFGPHYWMETSAALAELCIALPLAWWLRSAWALVAGYVALTLVRVAMSYVLHPFRPRLLFDRGRISTLLQFAPWMTGAAIIEWTLADGVTAYVGQVLGIEAFGAYLVAWRVTGQPVVVLRHLLSSATLPAYADLQDQPARAGHAFLRVFGVVALIGTPSVTFAALHAGQLVQASLGDDWIAAAPLVRILLVYALVRGLWATATPLLLGFGRARLQTLISLVELAVLAMLLPSLLTAWQAEGAAIATLAGALAGAGFTLSAATRISRLGLGPLVRTGLPHLVISAPILVVFSILGAPSTPASLLLHAVLSLAGVAAALAALVRAGWTTVDPLLSSWWRQAR
ncbi:MAG: oligosaccharide flippase family protein [Vicinamibacteria bacterium]|nr:oligosaccharide flippase family protein [Vicinamibacteria bacterium]